MGEKLTPSFHNVLRSLVSHPGEYLPQGDLPDGNGICSGGRYASGVELREMRLAGLIVYRPKERGYSVTEAGRLALAKHEEDGNGR